MAMSCCARGIQDCSTRDETPIFHLLRAARRRSRRREMKPTSPRRGCKRTRLGLTFAPHCTMSNPKSPSSEPATPSSEGSETGVPDPSAPPAGEIGGHESGLDPTRYGDWEKNGRCIDF